MLPVFDLTCRKTKNGKDACRMGYPCRHCVLFTHAVHIVQAPTALADGDPPDDDYPWRTCTCPVKFGKLRPRPLLTIPENDVLDDDENDNITPQSRSWTQPIAARDTRCLVFEMKRRHLNLPLIDMGAENAQVLSQSYVESLSGDTAALRNVFTALIALPNVNAALNEYQPTLLAQLRNMCTDDNETTSKLLYTILLKIATDLPCRNSYLVQHNEVFTALTGCNTAMYFMGTAEQAKQAMFYVVKYITKNKVDLMASVSVLHQARKKVAVPGASIAEDSGTESRMCKHFIQSALNTIAGNGEYGGPLAASIALGYPGSWNSHKFQYIFPWDWLTWLQEDDECQFDEHPDDASACSSSDNDDSASETDDEEQMEERRSDRQNGPTDPNLTVSNGRIRLEVPANLRNASAHTYKGPGGVQTAVSSHQHYMCRPKELYFMNAMEFDLLTEIKIKGTSNGGARGRKANSRFNLAPTHPLTDTHEIRLKSRIDPFILGGKPPPSLPKLPAKPDRSSQWQKRADAFAAYYLVLFRPYHPENVQNLHWDWDAFCEFMNQIHPFEKADEDQSNDEEAMDVDETVPTGWLPSGYRGRSISLRITTIAHGTKVDKVHNQLSIEWRNCMRTYWSTVQRDAFESSLMSRRDRDLANQDIENERDRASRLEEEERQRTSCNKQRIAVSVRLNALKNLTQTELTSRNNRTNASVIHTVHAQDYSHLDEESMNAHHVTLDSDQPEQRSEHDFEPNSNNSSMPNAVTEHDPLEMGPFREISQAEYDREVIAWKSQVRNGNADAHPPLTLEQRSALRPAVIYLQHYWQWVTRAWDLSSSDPNAALPPRPRAPLLLVHAEPGAGKSLLLSTLCRWLEEYTARRLRVSCCAMTGAAASLVPDGRTVYNLLGIQPGDFKGEKKGRMIEPLSHSNGAGNNPQLVRLQNMVNPLRNFNANDWTAGVIACDEVSQFTAEMLSHVDSRLREGALHSPAALSEEHIAYHHTGNIQTTREAPKDLPFGGQCVILFGDFFQKPPTFGDSLPTSVHYRHFTARAHVQNAPTSRGVQLFLQFKLKPLTRQMRTSGDEEHLNMLRAFRDPHAPSDTLLPFEYLKNMKVLCAQDIEQDAGWAYAPVAVTGNYERHVITNFRLKQYSEEYGLPLLKWKLTPAKSKAFEKLGNQTSRLYDQEDVLWGHLVTGAPGVITKNLAVHRRIANGSPCVMRNVGYFDSTTHADVQSQIQESTTGHEIEIQPPDYIIVEFMQGDAVKRFQDVTLQHGKAVVAIPTSVTDRKEVYLRGELAMDSALFKVDMHMPSVEVDYASTDYKCQGRSIPKLILSVMPTGAPPHMDCYGLYVLLTRATAGRDSIRLLLPDNVKPEVALSKLLKLKRDPHLITYLSRYDEDGKWIPPGNQRSETTEDDNQ